MTTEKRYLKCFISASAGTDLTLLLRTLQEHNISILDPAEFSPGAVTLTEKVMDGIKRSDLVVAIFSLESSNANVFFELGCAVGLGKQTLVIAPEGTDIPADLQGLLYIRSTVNNREALNFAFEQIKFAPQKNTKQSLLLDKSRPLGNITDNLLDQLTNLGKSPTEQQVVDVVQEMLEVSGIQTKLQPNPVKFRPDFAIWVGELEPYLGNPILIEINLRINTVKEANELIDKVLRYVKLSSTQTALVFTLELSSVAAEIVSKYPMLYFFKLNEFLERLRHESFGKIVRDERNARFHGRVN